MAAEGNLSVVLKEAGDLQLVSEYVLAVVEHFSSVQLKIFGIWLLLLSLYRNKGQYPNLEKEVVWISLSLQPPWPPFLSPFHRCAASCTVRGDLWLWRALLDPRKDRWLCGHCSHGNGSWGQWKGCGSRERSHTPQTRYSTRRGFFLNDIRVFLRRERPSAWRDVVTIPD